MQTDYIFIGASPPEEDCVQVGTDDYRRKSTTECERYIETIRHVCGPEPVGARLRLKWQQHDFGPYVEVVCDYEVENPVAIYYALFVEGNGPQTWNAPPSPRCECGLPMTPADERCEVCRDREEIAA